MRFQDAGGRFRRAAVATAAAGLVAATLTTAPPVAAFDDPINAAPGDATVAGGLADGALGRTVLAADVDGDGIDDLLTTQFDANNDLGWVHIWLGSASVFTADPLFIDRELEAVDPAAGRAPDASIAGLPFGQGLAVGDVEGDGINEIAVGGAQTGVFSYPGPGTFFPGDYAVTFLPGDATALLMDDFDGFPATDELAIGYGNTDEVVIWDADGLFVTGNPIVILDGEPGSEFGFALAAGELLGAVDESRDLFVSAPEHPGPSAVDGAVFGFDEVGRNGATSFLDAGYMVVNDGAGGDRFGVDLAMSDVLGPFQPGFEGLDLVILVSGGGSGPRVLVQEGQVAADPGNPILEGDLELYDLSNVFDAGTPTVLTTGDVDGSFLPDARFGDEIAVGGPSVDFVFVIGHDFIGDWSFNGVNTSEFGSSIAISDRRFMAVGAPFEDADVFGPEIDAGVIEIFDAVGVGGPPPFSGTLTVNTTSDEADDVIGDGLCETAAGECSLRAAIEEINAQAGGSIEFDIQAGAVPHVIDIVTPLPQVGDGVTIDGLTEPDASGDPFAVGGLSVVLRWTGGAVPADGLDLIGADSAVFGLNISGFPDAAVRVQGDNAQIESNRLGVRVVDVDPLVPNRLGVVVERTASGALILGNVVAGNNEVGIDFLGVDGLIEGNRIGTSIDGATARPNGVGINVGDVSVAPDQTVITDNVIAGNTTEGVQVKSGRIEMSFNSIGIGSGAAGPLPNGGDGVLIAPSGGASVEGRVGVPGAFNFIANNGGNGVTVIGAEPVEVRFNSVVDNGGLGIDIGNDGPDATVPVITDVAIDGPDVIVTVDTGAADQLVQIYRNDQCDPSGFGEGLGPVGFGNNLGSSAPVTVTFPLTNLVGSTVLTATTQDFAAPSQTSEFSACVSLPTDADVDAVSLAVDQPATGPGVTEVAITDIPIEALLASGEDTATEAAPLGAVPLGAVPLGAVPLGAVDLAQSPLGAVPLGAVPLGAVPLGAVPLGAVPLSAVPLGAVDFPGGWTAALVGTSFEGKPPQTVTLGELLAELPASHPIRGIPLGAVDLSASPLGAVSIAGLALGTAPLDDVANDICVDAAAQGVSCAEAGNTLIGLELSGYDVASAPLGAVPLGAVPLGAVPLGAVPLGAVPLGAVPLGAVPLGAVPLGAVPLGAVPLSAVRLGNTPLSVPLGAVRLGAVDLDTTPLGAVPLGAVDLQGTPLGAVPLGAVGDAAGGFGCDLFVAPTCADLGLDDDITLFEAAVILEASGSSLAATPLGAVPLGAVPLGAVEVDAAENLTTLADYFGAGTLADLPPEVLADLTLADILLALVVASDYAWEELDLTAIGIQDFVDTATEITYTATLTTSGNGLVPVVIDLPTGYRYRTGTATFGGAPALDPVIEETLGRQRLAWFLDTTAGTADLTFAVSPGLVLGTFDTSASATGGNGVVDTGPAASHTVQPAGGPGQAPADVLVLGYLTDPDEIDRFDVQSPGEGFTTSVFLSHQSQDSDLVLYKPETALPAGGDGETADGPTTQVVEDDGFAQSVGQDLEPEDLGDVPIDPSEGLGEASASRGIGDEQVSDTDDDGAPTTYGIQVSGYNGATSNEPYVLRVKFQQEIVAPACPARSFTGGGAAAPATALTPGLETLVVIDQQRFGDVHGAASAAEAVASAQALVDFLNTNNFGAAEILFVDSVTDFAAWDANPCDWEAADAVAKDVRELIVDYAAANESLRYVTILGGDDVIPFHRQPDATGYANESTFAAEFGPTEAPGVYGAFVARKILTDAPYGDPDPIPWLDRFLYLPEVSVGRLVEDAADVTAAIDTFIAFGGELDPGVSSLVTGYDFLSDGAAATTAALTDNGFATQEINNETWDDGALESAFLTDGGPRLVSANAHYDYYRALPAAEQLAGEATYGPDTLFQVTDVEDYLAGSPTGLNGNVLFTMGCHAALSVSDVALGASPSLPADWAQTLNGAGGSLIGNTGYGYGDTVTIGLTEEIIVGMADALDGDLTLGQAVVDSLQTYYSRAGLYGVYDEKVIQQFTTYGLPMYRVPGLGGEDDPDTDLVVGEDPFTGQPSASGTADVTASQVSSDKGTFWTVDGQTLEIHYRPIQPMTSIDVTVDGLVARGAIITDWTSTDVPVADMAYARPVVDDGDREAEIEDPNLVFPSTFAAVASYERPNPGPGARTIDAQNLNLIVGQYDGPSSTQRLFDDIEFEVFYVDPADALAGDDDPAVIRQVQASVVSGTVGFIVDLEDNASAARVVVLYRSDVSADWQSVDLVSGSPWSGGGPVPVGTSEVEYLVQVVEPSGLVSVSSSKGEFHRAEPADEPPAPGESGVTVDVSGPQSGPWYTGTVDLDVAGAAEVTVDGDPVPPSGTTIVDDGVHIVVVTADDGTEVTFVVPIDRTGPVVASGTPDIIPFGAVAEVDYDCRDAGSGVVSCVGSVADGATIVTSVEGTRSFTVTATDAAGNTTTRTFTYTVQAPPVVELSVTPTIAVVGQSISAVTTVSGFSGDVEIDWGDGTVETGRNLTHTYAFAGIYDVTASIRLSAGVTISETVSVVVFDPDGASISGNVKLDDPVLGRIDVQFNPRYTGANQNLTGHVQVKTPGSQGIDVRTDDLTFMVVSGAFGTVEGTGVLDGVEVIIRIEAASADADPNDSVTEDTLSVTITEVVSGDVVLDTGSLVADGNIRIKD